jgi:DNA-binding Lrp family transcriptional regulator
MCVFLCYLHTKRRITLDQTDVHLLRELEHGIPLVPAPFEEIGKRVGLTGNEVMERIRALKTAGLIRKLRARIDQRKVGITANALVAWNPAGAGDTDTGALLADFPSVTHCYERRPVPGRWEYTHYTVHHGHSRSLVLDEIRTVAEQSGCRDYLVLFSTREFKRVPNVRMRENGGDLR